MRVAMFTFHLLLLAHLAHSGVNLHNLRGSNNRLDGTSRELMNNKRLFNSKNHKRGGYNVGTDDNGKRQKLSYYTGEEIELSWTVQHGCGSQHTKHCEVILQYMCSDDIRDGERTATIRENGRGNEDYGMHETLEYYKECKKTQRNQRLFSGTETLNPDATSTRQNSAGTRYGFECPEEREYYPYWNPSPWKDIVIFTQDVENCNSYEAESQNVKEKSYCKPTANFQGLIPVTEEGCQSIGGEWSISPSHNVNPPDCFPVQTSKPNHLGPVAGKKGSNDPSQPLRNWSYKWKMPAPENGKTESTCVLRIRYNVTQVIDRNTDSESNQYPIWKDVGIAPAEARVRGYVLKDNPDIILPYPIDGNKQFKLQLNIKSRTLVNTYQDRSHAFLIQPRPKFFHGRLFESATLKSLTIGGKIGNIVQVFPATEFEFYPQILELNQTEFFHIQWTGSTKNPKNNDGGYVTRGMDTNNMCLLAGSEEVSLMEMENRFGDECGHLSHTNCAKRGNSLLGNNYPNEVNSEFMPIEEGIAAGFCGLPRVTRTMVHLVTSTICIEPAGDPTMVAGINAVNPIACQLFPFFGCTTALNDISQLGAIPAEMKNGLTVADLCPCGTCSTRDKTIFEATHCGYDHFFSTTSNKFSHRSVKTSIVVKCNN